MILIFLFSLHNHLLTQKVRVPPMDNIKEFQPAQEAAAQECKPGKTLENCNTGEK